MTSGLPYLDASAVFGVVPWEDAVDVLEHSLLDGLDPSGAPPRSIVDVEQGQLLLMPAETGTGVGVKLGTVAPGNPPRGLPRIQATYVLYDPVTLSIRALLDGTALTTLRTPAVSAVAVRHLAAPDAERLVVFGSGPQAWGHVEALRAVRPVREVTVVARDPERAGRLAERIRTAGTDARVGRPADVTEADIVVCATTAREPLFDGDLLAEGACVVAVGSHEPQARELDTATMRRAARVVVEDPAVALREAGDVILAVREGALSQADLVGLSGGVRLEPTPGVSVFKSVGMGWQDLVVAELAFDRWREKHDG